MTSALPNPFDFGQPESSRFVLDEAAFMAALDPLPVFLTGPRVDPDRGRGRTPRPGIAASLSAVLRELSELVHPLDVGGRRS